MNIKPEFRTSKEWNVKKRFKVRHPSSVQKAPPERVFFHGFYAV